MSGHPPPGMPCCLSIFREFSQGCVGCRQICCPYFTEPDLLPEEGPYRNSSPRRLSLRLCWKHCWGGKVLDAATDTTRETRSSHPSARVWAGGEGLRTWVCRISGKLRDRVPGSRPQGFSSNPGCCECPANEPKRWRTSFLSSCPSERGGCYRRYRGGPAAHPASWVTALSG